jgi:hypothetical protein
MLFKENAVGGHRQIFNAWDAGQFPHQANDVLLDKRLTACQSHSFDATFGAESNHAMYFFVA